MAGDSDDNSISSSTAYNLIAEATQFTEEIQRLQNELYTAQQRIKEQDVELAKQKEKTERKKLDLQETEIADKNLRGTKGYDFWGAAPTVYTKEMERMLEEERKLKEEAVEELAKLKSSIRQFCGEFLAIIKQLKSDQVEVVEGPGERNEGLKELSQLFHNKLLECSENQEELKSEISQMTTVANCLKKFVKGISENLSTVETEAAPETLQMEADTFEDNCSELDNIAIIGTYSLSPAAASSTSGFSLENFQNEKESTDIEILEHLTSIPELASSGVQERKSGHGLHPTNKLKCICGFQTNTRSNLRHHLQDMTFDKKFCCGKCPKRFLRYSCLRRHVLYVHKDEEMYEKMRTRIGCRFCGISFRSSKAYYSHQKIIHRQACLQNNGKLSRENATLLKSQLHSESQNKVSHEQDITKINFGPHCICGKYYQSIQALKKHIRDEKRKDGIPCKICWKKFLDTRDLQKHLKDDHKIEDERKVPRMKRCVKCTLSFRTSRQLVQHNLNDHAPQTSNKAAVLHEARIDQKGKLYCSCGSVFSRETGIQRHIWLKNHENGESDKMNKQKIK